MRLHLPARLGHRGVHRQDLLPHIRGTVLRACKRGRPFRVVVGVVVVEFVATPLVERERSRDIEEEEAEPKEEARIEAFPNKGSFIMVATCA